MQQGPYGVMEIEVGCTAEDAERMKIESNAYAGESCKARTLDSSLRSATFGMTDMGALRVILIPMTIGDGTFQGE